MSDQTGRDPTVNGGAEQTPRGGLVAGGMTPIQAQRLEALSLLVDKI
jgi:hypothetical protein